MLNTFNLLFFSVWVIEQLLQELPFGFVKWSTYYSEVSNSRFLCNTGKKIINAVLFCFTGLLQDCDNPYSRFENE